MSEFKLIHSWTDDKNVPMVLAVIPTLDGPRTMTLAQYDQAFASAMDAPLNAPSADVELVSAPRSDIAPTYAPRSVHKLPVSESKRDFADDAVVQRQPEPDAKPPRESVSKRIKRLYADQLIDSVELRRFVLAGRSEFIVVSASVEYRFRINQPRRSMRGTRPHFVNLIEGGQRKYIGTIFTQKIGSHTFRSSAKSCYREGQTQFEVFNALFTAVFLGDGMPEDQIVRHVGNCGKCGRTLTEPESIARGIGPVCYKRLTA